MEPNPEQQEQYDLWVTRGMEMMYHPEVMPQLLKTVSGDGDPIEGLANAFAIVLTRMQDSAEKKGVNVSPEVKGHGAIELLDQLAELAGPDGADIHKFTDEEKDQVLGHASRIYQMNREQQGGKSPQDVEPEQPEQQPDQQSAEQPIEPGRELIQ